MKTKTFCISVHTILVLLYLTNYAELYVTSRRRCTTPNGKSGLCKPSLQCQSFVKYVNDSKHTMPDVAHILRDYSCGYEGNTTKVCCPRGSVTVTNKIPDPPDVTNHKKLHLLPKECGLIDTGDKIRNGENAGLNEFPWMALLSYNTSNGPKFKCGGTVINDRYILTAAHCVVNISDPLLRVRVGEYDIGKTIDCFDKDTCLPPVQDLSIQKVIYPADYNVTLYANDIALIRVSKINLHADNVKSVCLPINDENRNREYEKGVVTGWGFTDPSEKPADILQKVLLEKRNMSICIKAYGIKPQIKLNYKQLCIGGIAKKDSCRGDSGGPFHVATYFNDDDRYVQYGIVSIGPVHCGYEGVPVIYTHVSYYMNWILDNLKP